MTAGIYKPDFALTFNGEEVDYNHPYGILFFQNAVELRGGWLFRGDFYWNIKGHHGIYEQNSHASFNLMAQKQLLNKRLTVTLRGEDLFNWSKLKDVKKVNFVIQNRAVNNFSRCVIALSAITSTASRTSITAGEPPRMKSTAFKSVFF